MQKGVNRLFVAAGHKKKQISIKKKKKKNRMPGAMGLKTVKTFLSSIYSSTRARQW